MQLPNTREKSTKQEGAIALDEGGEEGEDAIDGQRDKERLATANPVSKGTPQERPHHHPEVYNQT